MYVEALGWLQDSGLGQFARSGGFAYAAVNSLHVLGAALLLGAIAVFDVLVLRGRAGAAAGAATVAVPLAAFGLALQVATGLVLLAADARASGTNPAFLAKIALIGIGLANVMALRWRFGPGFRKGFDVVALRPYAALSLVTWTLAVLAGRMIAYV